MSVAKTSTVLLHHTYNSEIMVQVVWTWAASARVFYRIYNSGWGPWQLIGLPILGTVSQSGGSPTGAIIERGSNSNGEYVRFADGTQICTFDVAMPASNGALVTASATVPAAYIATPGISVTARTAADTVVKVLGNASATLAGTDEDARNLTNLALAAQLRLAGEDAETITVYRDGDNLDHALTLRRSCRSGSSLPLMCQRSMLPAGIESHGANSGRLRQRHLLASSVKGRLEDGLF
jgi:hypothetical protein